jgi:hypothetical protein
MDDLFLTGQEDIDAGRIGVGILNSGTSESIEHRTGYVEIYFKDGSLFIIIAEIIDKIWTTRNPNYFNSIEKLINYLNYNTWAGVDIDQYIADELREKNIEVNIENAYNLLNGKYIDSIAKSARFKK